MRPPDSAEREAASSVSRMSSPAAASKAPMMSSRRSCESRSQNQGSGEARLGFREPTSERVCTLGERLLGLPFRRPLGPWKSFKIDMVGDRKLAGAGIPRGV